MGSKGERMALGPTNNTVFNWIRKSVCGLLDQMHWKVERSC